MPRESDTGELQTVFARVSGLLLTDQVAGPAIARIAQAACESIPGSLGAGATLISAQGRPTALMLANIQAHESAERLSDALKNFLHSRSVIDMAKGVLMERLSVDERAALRSLTDRSREEGAPLFTVALRVIDRHPESAHERP
jgi:AmiR/NasT family two-component response regulator